MIFQITHKTSYTYPVDATDYYSELRICPQDSSYLKVHDRHLKIDPDVPIETYNDYFGNRVEFFSIPFRHPKLAIESFAEVETLSFHPPDTSLDVTFAEALQIYNSRMLDIYDFLQPTAYVPHNVTRNYIKESFFPSHCTLRETLLELNFWIYSNFTYAQGSTRIDTPLNEILETRKGVCQDFSHLMLSIIRSAGIPARYVSGYIESTDPTKTKAEQDLVGNAASHAWIEVFLPGGFWWGLDPTNTQTAGERHIPVAFGRDYRDAAPVRGTFKGSNQQNLDVTVTVRRK